MDSARYLVYRTWADDLEKCPREEFVANLDKYTSLLETQNITKFRDFESGVSGAFLAVHDLKEAALSELKPLVRTVSAERAKLPDEIINHASLDVREFEDIVNGVTRFNGYPKLLALFDALRLTIELCVQNSCISVFNNLISEREGFKFVDHVKFSTTYPAYSKYVGGLERFDELAAVEPWGSYYHIKYRDRFLDTFIKENVGNTLRSSYVRRFKDLILYLVTQERRAKLQPSVQSGIPKLFSLSSNPTAIYYRGVGKGIRDWVPTRGKTQPYAVLKLAADKYTRNSRVRGSFISAVRLSCAEIMTYISKNKNCNHTPEYAASYTEKRKLDHLLKNITALAPFTDYEVFVERRAGGKASLVFVIPS